MAKYNTITDPNSDFKYGLLYGNFSSGCKRPEDEINSSPLIAQRIFEFAYDNCIPISLGQTNPYGSCGVCNIYHINISKAYLSWRLKSPYLYLLLGHSNVKNGNKQYIDKATGWDWSSALGHTYYYRNVEKGYIISVRANIANAPFWNTAYKSAEELAGLTNSHGGLKNTIQKSLNPGNTFKFTDDWYLECAKYMLKGIEPESKSGCYRELTKYTYRFIEFLFKDYKREYKYENDYIKQYLGAMTDDVQAKNGSSSIYQGSDVFSDAAPEESAGEGTSADPGNGKFLVSDGKIRVGEWNSNYNEVIEYGKTNHIPVVILATAVGCVTCNEFKTAIAGSAKFKEWVARSPYLFAYAFSGSGWWTTEPQRKLMELVGNGGMPRISGYWAKADGSVVGGKDITKVGAPVSMGVDWFINYWDDMFAEYRSQGDGPVQLNALVRDCDSTTRNNYKTGVWYGNVRPSGTVSTGGEWNAGFCFGVPTTKSDQIDDLESIFSYAEKTNTPLVLLETNLRGTCNECNILHNQMLANSTLDSFNAWKSRSGCLWFVDTTFQTNTKRFEYLYSKFGFPTLKNGGNTIMFFYWKKSDGTVVKAPFWPCELKANYGNYTKLVSKDEFLDSTQAKAFVPPSYFDMRMEYTDLLNELADQYYEAYRANFEYTPGVDGPARRIGVFIDAFLSDGGNKTIYRPNDSSYAIIASYDAARPTVEGSMNKVDAANAMSIIKNYVPEKNIITYNTKGGGLTPTATAILNKIGEVCQSEECSFLYIFMSAHGGHSGSGSNECSYMQFKGVGAQAISNLTGKALWEKVKDAKCKIFLMIHTCHAGGFFNDPGPAQFSAGEDQGEGLSFIEDFAKYADQSRAETAVKAFSASQKTGPTLLMWSSNKSEEYGWSLEPFEQKQDPAWWTACGGRVGTMLLNSLLDHYDPDKSYLEIWRAMTADGELCRLNQYNVKGSLIYTGKGAGPTPQYYVYGDFDINEKIFTSDSSYRYASDQSQYDDVDDDAYIAPSGVVPGEWTSDFETAKQYAIQAGTPFIAVWSLMSSQCHFCSIFEEMATGDYFMNWAKRYKPVMAYVKTKGWAGEIPWITGKDTSREIPGAPGVRVYWEKDGKVLADEIFMGRGSKIGGTDGAALVNKITSILGDMDDDVVPPTSNEKLLYQFINTRDLGESLVTGRVRRDLTQCIKWAEQYGIPLVGIWSSEGCSHCTKLARAMYSKAFRTRMRTSGIIICYIFSSDGSGIVAKTDPEGKIEGAGYHWCWGKGNDKIYKTVGIFPFVRMYWKKDGKQIVDKTVSGGKVVNYIGTDVKTGTMTDDYGTYKTVAGKTSNKAGAYAINYLIKAFPGYEPVYSVEQG